MPQKNKPLVSIIMGSQSDYSTMKFAEDTLKSLQIKFDTKIVSAHRTPKRLFDFASKAERNNISVIIAGAGGSAHLPGMVAAITHIPVIGVPIESKKLKGLDSLLSIVQMPKGIPVGTVAIGKDGAINAALFAASILGVGNKNIKSKLKQLRLKQTKSVKKNQLNNMSEQTVGILGGGQLGSLLCLGAKKLNIKTVVYCDDKDAPAQIYADQFIFGDYKDNIKIQEFINKVDVVTYEFENIPFETLDLINQYKQVKPKPEVNKIVQHRLYEKDFVNKCNISTTRYVSIKEKADLNANLKLIPALLKTCRLGYDGKGQYKLNNLSDVENLKIDFSEEYILEKMIKLKKEFSIILTRFGHSIHSIYEPIENEHENQILKYSKIPATIDEKIITKAKDWASIIADDLDYIGTICVEYFIDKNDNLYVNEIAPRVHNSGHLTINTYNISQFENHIRAICDLGKVEIKKLYNARMINLIGDQIVPYRTKKFNDNEFFFDYGKKEIKPNRKMGHLTIIQKVS